MSTENGKTALSGHWVSIGADQFHLMEYMVMEFEKESCSPADSADTQISSYNQNSGRVTVDVSKGCRCDIMKAYVRFFKMPSSGVVC